MNEQYCKLLLPDQMPTEYLLLNGLEGSVVYMVGPVCSDKDGRLFVHSYRWAGGRVTCLGLYSPQG